MCIVLLESKTKSLVLVVLDLFLLLLELIEVASTCFPLVVILT